MKLAIASLLTFATLAFALHAASSVQGVSAPIDPMDADASESFWIMGTKAYIGGEEGVSLSEPTYNHFAQAWAQ